MEDFKGSCAEDVKNKCWDGSERANDWPECKCPDFDHDTKYKCP